MEANSLFITNHSFVVVAPSPPPRVSLKPQPPLLIGFCVPNSYPVNLQGNRSSKLSSSFKSRLASPGSSVSPVNAREEDTSRADQQHFPSLKALLRVYKEAIFNGDVKTVSEVEARI